MRHLSEAVRTLRDAGVEVVVGTCPDLGTVRPIPPPLRQVARAWSRRLAAAKTIAVVEQGGRTVSLSAKFLRTQPDLYAHSVRFELPVLLDRPYRYRVTTALPDGTLDVGPWTERQSWSQILDVTSRPDEVTAAPPRSKVGEPE